MLRFWLDLGFIYKSIWAEFTLTESSHPWARNSSPFLKLIHFNCTDFFIMVSDTTLKLTLKKLSLFKFGHRIKEYFQLLEKAIKIPLLLWTLDFLHLHQPKQYLTTNWIQEIGKTSCLRVSQSLRDLQNYKVMPLFSRCIFFFLKNIFFINK